SEPVHAPPASEATMMLTSAAAASVVTRNAASSPPQPVARTATHMPPPKPTPTRATHPAARRSVILIWLLLLSALDARQTPTNHARATAESPQEKSLRRSFAPRARAPRRAWSQRS